MKATNWGDTVIVRSVGVEEELLLVDPDSGKPQAVSGAVLGADEGGRIGAELQCEQLETGTRPCTGLDDLAAEIRRWRTTASERARRAGAEVVALATSPLLVDPSLTPKIRYQRMAEEFALTAHEQLTCGCHVHVRVASDAEGVAVLDRMRPWLAPLIALSANSPFWRGRDSGYDSYRYQAWCRWPSAGPGEVFGSARRYRGAVRAMLDSGTLLDEGMIYFDARLSRRYPTVEIRVADVCLDADDTVLVAALVRGLVETSARAWRAGEPADPVSSGLLRLAAWRASRSSLEGDLLHPVTHTPVPALVVVRRLVDHITPALADTGDLDLVKDHLGRLLSRGNGAAAQRAAYHRSGSLGSVVCDAIARTVA